MLSIDPGDGPGSAGHAVTPAQPLTDIVPLQAMANGGTIIRPGAVAWGGTWTAEAAVNRGGPILVRVDRTGTGRGRREPRAIARPAHRACHHPAVGPAAGPAAAVHRRAAVRLPLIGYQDIEFVPASPPCSG